jgi:hypothetical protein
METVTVTEKGRITFQNFISSVKIVIGYRPDVLVSIPDKGRVFSLSSSPRSDRVCGPPRPLSSGCRGLSPRGRGQIVKLATYFHLLSRLRMIEFVPPLPHTSSWHGV